MRNQGTRMIYEYIAQCNFFIICNKVVPIITNMVYVYTRKLRVRLLPCTLYCCRSYYARLLFFVGRLQTSGKLIKLAPFLDVRIMEV